MSDDDVMVEDEERVEKPAAPFWTVAIYLVDRSYGGPEEGGWWFDHGERVDHALDDVPSQFLLCVSETKDLANAEARRVQRLLDATVNVGRRDIDSVLSTGRYHAQVHNGHPPTRWPERRPHYE